MLTVVRELETLNGRWKARADARGDAYQEVGFRIGIATGNYSVHGDNVNLASRLEGVNKFYRTKILASEVPRNLSPKIGVTRG